MTYTRLTLHEQASISRASHWQAIRDICRDLRGWPTGHPDWQIARRMSIRYHLRLWREAFDATQPRAMKEAA